ncbi:MAG TPA: right-handed parallel beta-helix repeat-containing protein, partial [Armatimonadota bacterium]|nr:right-handed parallel beta-helix repeat-containing protein [Armatimonadota bacterium]
MNTTASIPRAYPAFRFLACLLVTCLCASATAGIVYVNKNAPGPAHDGTNWSTAFLTVQAGSDAAVSGDEVWVAKSSPAATAYVENVTLKNGVSLYGGFAGVETERSQRNVALNLTVVSSPSTGNVVILADVNQTTIDGFTLRNGMVGVDVASGTVTVSNCTISGNTNGISMPFGTATVTNCTISDNAYDGLWLYQGKATLSNCVISGNDNGVYVNYSSASLYNCTITGNSADGVGLYAGTATVSNCIISKNSDGVYVESGTAMVTNCTISGNRDGVFVEYDTA